MTGSRGSLLIASAPALFVLFWASGFPISKFGLEFIEPFTLLALRSAVNVAVVAAIIPFIRISWPRSWADAGHIAVSGLLLQVAYLSCIFIALGEGVAQGMVALIAGMQPLLTAAVVGRLLGEKINTRQWAGFVLGFGGLALVLWERIGIGTGTVLGFAVVALAPILITAGSLYQKRFCADMDLRAGMLIQHTVAGLANFAIALSFESRVVQWGPEVVFVVAWLVVLLSIGATNLYYILLRRGEAARVSSLFYLTPPTAVFLGYVTYGEVFGATALAGFAVAVLGVALVTRRGRTG